MSAMDIAAEREKICREIEELERSLDPTIPNTYIEVSSSSLESGSENEDDLEDDLDTQVDMEVDLNGLIGTDTEDVNEVSINLPQTPETCLQMNLVYQEVIQEKIEEINLLLAQNKEQQEKLTWELAGTKATKSGDGKSLPVNVYLGHFIKPYFKDKTSGIGPPANNDTREKAKQGIKSFEELITIKWKSREKQLLHDSVVSDRLQRLLQPKLLSLSYLREKQAKSKDEMEKQILEKQIQEKECEINDINLLPEETLLVNRFEEHDWDKIANINFEGTRSATELRKYWQNSEHPNINKKEWSPEEIQKLKEIAARHNYLDWGAIAQELGTQRTAFQCLQKFQAYNKDFKKSEWSSEEDQMLLHLVQEMRVGKHIPYRKIAYYMEGRDSAQLIYRWTKRVDPNLKHGAWTAEEDALLLKAVAKYGERDWYKIRTEVPGRSDSQCRYRYLLSLHCNIKKGKWSEEEERKLVELTEKYGVGHWAKIASELPHRSGSQCLSKWKGLLGYRSKQKKKREKHIRRGNPSSSESSSGDSDLDLEEDSTEKNESKNCKENITWHWQVPSIDLWVPTRKNLSETTGKELASVTLLSKGFDVNRKRRPIPGALLVQEEHQAADGLINEDSRNLQSSQNKEKEDSAEKGNQKARSTKDSWRVSLAYVKSVLRRNSYELQRRNREIRRKKRFASASQAARLSVSADSRACKGYGQKNGIWRTTLFRRLMMAVTPWAGSMVQNWALRVKREVSAKSKAEFIFKHLQSASLTSTPLFTLFIQLLRIDVDGCMNVIKKRKSLQSELLKSVVNAQRTSQASSSKDPEAQHNLEVANPTPSKKLIPLKAKKGPVPAGSSWEAVPYRLATKPKTVSELLQEKRKRESKAKKAEQNRLLLTPQLLLSSPVIIQPQRVPTTQMTSGPQRTILPAPVKTQGMLLPLSTPCRTPLLSTMESSLASLPKTATGLQEIVLTRNGMGDSPLGNRSKSCGTGSVLPRASPGLPTVAYSLPLPTPAPLQVSAAELPKPIASQNSVTMNSGIKKIPCTAAQGLPGSPNNPGSVVPTLVTAQPGIIPKQILPITWVLTPQGLVPMTVVNLPSQGNAPTTCPAAAPNLGKVAETPLFANVSTVNVVPVVSGLNSPQPGPLLQRVTSSSSPQNHEVSQHIDLTLCPSPLPLARESQSSPSTPCSPGHLLSTTPSLNSSQPGIPETAALASAPQNQILGNPLCPAPPDNAKSTPNPVVQSNHTCPAAPSQQEKISPDYSLLSLENVAVVKEWLKGRSYGRVPTSEAHLPYLPPFLCSLKTLSALLLNKEALERSATSLVTPEGQQEESSQLDLDALRTMVQQRLQDNPAYRLLKDRFLATFTFPSALAALPPLRVTTTLSGSAWWQSRHREEERPSSEEEEDSEIERISCETVGDRPRRTADSHEEQEENPAELEEPNTDSMDSEQFSTSSIRRSSRLWKRRRQL